MAGSAKKELRSAIVQETVNAQIPTDPTLTEVPFETVNIKGTPQYSEDRPQSAGNRLNGLGRNGIEVAGDISGSVRYGALDIFLSSLLQAEWAADTLVDSTSGSVSFSLENTIPQGRGGIPSYTRFRGLEIVSGTLTAQDGQDVSIDFNVQGVGSDDATIVELPNATYVDPVETPKIGSGSSLGDLVVQGYTLGCIQSMTMTAAQQDKERQGRIFSDDACGIDRGALDLTFDLVLYIEESFNTLYNAARSDIANFATTFTLGTIANEKYTFSAPRCQFTDASPDYAGRALQNVQIRALYNSATDRLLQVDRNVA